jgi:hypothetical protein
MNTYRDRDPSVMKSSIRYEEYITNACSFGLEDFDRNSKKKRIIFFFRCKYNNSFLTS